MPRPGQVLGLVGTNGIGKSTAIKVLAGKLKPNLGRFTVRLTPSNQEQSQKLGTKDLKLVGYDVHVKQAQGPHMLCCVNDEVYSSNPSGALHGASHKQNCSPRATSHKIGKHWAQGSELVDGRNHGR